MNHFLLSRCFPVSHWALPIALVATLLPTPVVGDDLATLVAESRSVSSGDTETILGLIDAIQQALSLDPNSDRAEIAALRIGELYGKAGLPESALLAYLELAESAPTSYRTRLSAAKRALPLAHVGATSIEEVEATTTLYSVLFDARLPNTLFPEELNTFSNAREAVPSIEAEAIATLATLESLSLESRIQFALEASQRFAAMFEEASSPRPMLRELQMRRLASDYLGEQGSIEAQLAQLQQIADRAVRYVQMFPAHTNYRLKICALGVRAAYQSLGGPELTVVIEILLSEGGPNHEGLSTIRNIVVERSGFDFDRLRDLNAMADLLLRYSREWFGEHYGTDVNYQWTLLAVAQNHLRMVNLKDARMVLDELNQLDLAGEHFKSRYHRLESAFADYERVHGFEAQEWPPIAPPTSVQIVPVTGPSESETKSPSAVSLQNSQVQSEGDTTSVIEDEPRKWNLTWAAGLLLIAIVGWTIWRSRR